MQVEALTSPAGQVTPITAINGTTPNAPGQANFGQLFQLFAGQVGPGVTPDTLNALMPQAIAPQAMLAMLSQTGSPIPLQLLSNPASLVNESQMSQAEMVATDVVAALQTLLGQLDDGTLSAEGLSQMLSEAGLNLDSDSETSLDPATLNGLLSLLAGLQNTPQAVPLDQPTLQPEIVAKPFQALTEVPGTQQAVANLAQQNISAESTFISTLSNESSPELTAFVERIIAVLSQAQPEATSQSQATPTTVTSTIPTTTQNPEFADAVQGVSGATVTAAASEVEPLSTPVLTSAPAQNTAPVHAVSSPVIVERPTNLTTPILNQVAEAIVVTQAEGKTDVRLTLQPEALGQVSVQLQLNDGDLSVRLLAETAQAQVAIRDHLPQLKSALAAQGLQIAGFTLDVGSDGSDLNNAGQQNNHQPQAQPNFWHVATSPEADQPDLMTNQAEQRQLGLSSINYHV